MVDLPNADTKLLNVHTAFVLLRKLVSFSARVFDFSEGDIADMKYIGRQLFLHMCAWGHGNLSNSMWVLTNVALIHAETVFKQYGCRLGLLNMETPRTETSYVIARYLAHTVSGSDTKWGAVFRHSFIENIYLKEHGRDLKHYRSRGYRCIPLPNSESCSQCTLKLAGTQCI